MALLIQQGSQTKTRFSVNGFGRILILSNGEIKLLGFRNSSALGQCFGVREPGGGQGTLLINLTQQLGSLGVFSLAVQDDSQIQAGIDEGRINLYCLFEGSGCVVEMSLLQIDYAKIVEGSQILG